MSFSTLYRCKGICDDAKTLSEMADNLESAAKELREMEVAGVTLDGPVNDDYAELYTENQETATKYGLTELEDDLEEEDDKEFGEGLEEEGS